jgi:Dyp-type peroxidase family
MTERPGVSRRHLFISGGLVATAPLLGAARRAEGIDDQGTRPDQPALERADTARSAKGTPSAKAIGGRQAPDEPYLDGDEIQGNVLPGFMKPYMAVAALTIGDIARAKGWLTDVAPRITTLAQAMQSRAKVRAHRGLGPERLNLLGALPPGMNDVWLNIALSSGGLSKLLSGGGRAGDLGLFVDQGFQRGLAARSSLLGDPTDRSAEGNPANWVFGGPGRQADVLLILAADREAQGARVLAEVRAGAVASGLTVLYEESGHKLDAIGKEHFGFQDGISQPGVRGRLQSFPGDFITPRTIAPSCLPDAWLYGRPGQYLVWPGEFVFGYPRSGADPLIPGQVNLPGPAWSRNGSYLVFRRLRQDVAGFRAFLAESAEMLSGHPGFEGVTPEWVGSRLVGRWPSGAPIARVPYEDNTVLGVDHLANNNFGFAADAPEDPLVAGLKAGQWPDAKADPVGLTCPMAAHIRKVNAREAASDLGGRRASFSRRILRRSLPFGPALGELPGRDPANGNRGLLFACYQASIEDQFEFLCNGWAGSSKRPRSPSGFDMVIGQNGMPGDRRERSCTVFGSGAVSATLVTMNDFVVPTGGGYFFSPSISALKEVLAV